MTERKFYIQTSSGSDGLTLHIEDDISGVTLADIQFTPEEAFKFIKGSTMHLTGTQTSHLDRVGKRMVHESLEVPGSLLRDVQYGERVDVGVQWARENAPGWDAYEVRRTNTGGVKVVVRKWIDDTPCGALDPDGELECTLPVEHDGNHVNSYTQWGA